MFLKNLDKHISINSASSVYSRSPETKKPLSKEQPTPKLPASRDLPEINSLDHQIALACGSTMALETTRVRLQCSKAEIKGTLDELRLERLNQYNQQENENTFYRACRDILRELFDSTRDILRDFNTNNPFEPESLFLDSAKVQKVIRALRVALETSRTEEARAEQEWKRQWNTSRIWKPADRWL